MIFYLVHTSPPTIVGTQADARQAAKAVEAKNGRRGWEQIDIPTDKAGLMAYVSDLMAETGELQAAISEEVGAGPAYRPRDMDDAGQPVVEPPINMASVAAGLAKASVAPAPTPGAGAEQLVDWLFDHATSAQIYDVFYALNSRYANVIKEVRNAKSI